MTCAEAVHVLLEADPAELAGRGDDPLARHLRECPSCMALAGEILAIEGELARELESAVPPLELDRILDMAAAAGDTAEMPEGAPEVLPFQTPSSGRVRRAALRLLPLAAAAVLATLFVAREPQLPGPSFSPPVQAPGLDVEVPEGRNVAVLKTSDPDITVLWLF